MEYTYVYMGNDNIDIFRNNKLYVCVRDSSIPGAGKGLYACKPFTKGVPVGTYTGKILCMRKAAAAEMSDSLCLMEVTLCTEKMPGFKKTCKIGIVDGALPPDDKPFVPPAKLGCKYGPIYKNGEWPGMHAHIMNDACGLSMQGENNCLVMGDGSVMTTKEIPSASTDGASPGDRPDPASELMLSYGEAYWGIQTPQAP